MQTFFQIFLIIHIAGGATGLLTGAWNVAAKKGNSTHKIIGNIFTVSMLIAGFSALVLSAMRPNLFLFMVGIFTVYLVGTGKRYLRLNTPGSHPNPAIIDLALSGTMLMAGALLIVYGALSLFKSNFFGLVLLTFGTIAMLYVKQDIRIYREKTDVVNFALSQHLQRMTAGFIASSTAFLVVNAGYLPDFIPAAVYWLLPTAILTPLIVKWAKKYEVRKP
jgi:uncharacterized membrane protein